MVDERDAQPAAVCHVSTVESARNLGIGKGWEGNGHMGVFGFSRNLDLPT